MSFQGWPTTQSSTSSENPQKQAHTTLLKNRDGHKKIKIRYFLYFLSHTCFLRDNLQSRKVSLKYYLGKCAKQISLKIGISRLGLKLTNFMGKRDT
jgi:hypothetical protein